MLSSNNFVMFFISHLEYVKVAHFSFSVWGFMFLGTFSLVLLQYVCFVMVIVQDGFYAF
jgi:hypothetical protein